MQYSLSAVLLLIQKQNLLCVFDLENVLRDEVKSEKYVDAPLPELPATKRSKPLTAEEWYHSGRLTGPLPWGQLGVLRTAINAAGLMGKKNLKKLKEMELVSLLEHNYGACSKPEDEEEDENTEFDDNSPAGRTLAAMGASNVQQQCEIHPSSAQRNHVRRAGVGPSASSFDAGLSGIKQERTGQVLTTLPHSNERVHILCNTEQLQ
jgi:hypothetical protein